MSGAGRGLERGSYQEITPAARAMYGTSLSDILAEHGYALEIRGMPEMDAQGRRVGGRHGERGVGRFGASWSRADHEAIHGEIGGDAE